MLKIKEIANKKYVKYIMTDVIGVEQKKTKGKNKGDTIDYYTAKDSVKPPFENAFRYWGGGFKKFDIEGSFENDKTVFENMFAGKHPHNKKKAIVSNAKSKDRKQGYDMVFSACKELSVLVAHAKITGDKELEDKLVNIHRESVNYALREMEKNVIVRRGKEGVEKQDGVGLFVFQADHFDARPTKTAMPDMQLHTHAVTLAYGLAKDGKIICLEGLSVVQQADIATANYRMKMAELLQSQGFHVTNKRFIDDFDKPMKRMDFKVEGVSEHIKKKFSKRREDIDDFMLENGTTGNYASLVTRNNKNVEQDYEVIAKHWKQELDEVLAEHPDALQLDQSKLEDHLDPATATDEQILDQVHRNKNRLAINSLDIQAVVTELYTGYEDAEEKIKTRMKSLLANDKDLCSLAPLTPLDRKQYCSMKLVHADLNVRGYIEKQNQINQHFLDRNLIQQSMEAFETKRGFKLTDEQKNAISMSCGNGGMTVVVGRAGVGKSTSAEVTAEAYKQSGYKLLGISVSNAASEILQKESGFPSVSVAKFLHDYKNGKIKLDVKTVVYLDEVGMCGLSMFNELANIVDVHDSKLIIAGDPFQLKSVEPGNALKVALQCSDHRAEITTIIRQKDVEDRKIANAFYDMKTKKHGESMFHTLTKKGYMEKTKYADEAIEVLANAYVEDPTEPDEKLVTAGRNENVIALNKAIQRRLIAKGSVDAKPIRKLGAYIYHENDKVIFSKTINFGTRHRPLKVINGTKGIVLPATEDKLLRVQIENGQVITIPDDMNETSMGLAFALTIHKSQGASRDNCYCFVDGVKHALALVQFTRMKRKIKYFGDAEQMEQFKKCMHIVDNEAGCKELLDNDQLEKAYKEYNGILTRKLKAMDGYEALDNEGMKSLIINEVDTMREVTLEQLKKDITRRQNETEEEYNKRLPITKPWQDPAIEIVMDEEAPTVAKTLSQVMPKADKDPVAKNVEEHKLFNMKDSDEIARLLQSNKLSLISTEMGDLSVAEVYSKNTTARRLTMHLDGAVSLSYDALKKGYTEDFLNVINKNQHFDPKKTLTIGVNDKLKFFKEEEQREYLEKVIKNLVNNGHPIENIRVRNDGLQDVLNKVKNEIASAPVVKIVETNEVPVKEKLPRASDEPVSEFGQFVKQNEAQSAELMKKQAQVKPEPVQQTQPKQPREIHRNRNRNQNEETQTATKKKKKKLSI